MAAANNSANAPTALEREQVGTFCFSYFLFPESSNVRFLWCF